MEEEREGQKSYENFKNCVLIMMKKFEKSYLIRYHGKTLVEIHFYRKKNSVSQTEFPG